MKRRNFIRSVGLICLSPLLMKKRSNCNVEDYNGLKYGDVVGVRFFNKQGKFGDEVEINSSTQKYGKYGKKFSYPIGTYKGKGWCKLASCPYSSCIHLLHLETKRVEVRYRWQQS